MTKAYKVILFDLDNTLIDEIECKRGALKAICDEKNISYSEEILNKFLDFEFHFWKEYDNGKIVVPADIKLKGKHKEWVRAQRFIYTFDTNLDIAYELDIIYAKNLSNSVKVIEHAEALLRHLYGKYFLCVATNSESFSAKLKLKKANLLHYFDYVFCGEDFYTSKPRKEFFKNLMDVIKFKDISKMMIVGDSLSTDIMGGINIGMDTYFFNPNGAIIPSDIKVTKEFKSLKELTYIL